MPVVTSNVQAFADELFAAERDGKQIAPFTGRADLTAADAYAIQLANVKRRQDAGESVVGMKVGLTAKAIQTMLGSISPTSVISSRTCRSPMVPSVP